MHHTTTLLPRALSAALHHHSTVIAALGLVSANTAGPHLVKPEANLV
jgi:hypothetical protein